LLQDRIHFGALKGSTTSLPSSHAVQGATPSFTTECLQVGWRHWLHPKLLSIFSKDGLV